MPELNHRAAAIARAEARNNVNEKINNRGTRIDEYLQNAGRLPSDPTAQGPQYCGMFVYWCYSQAARTGETNPLPRAVFGGSAFATWANSHQDKIVYRAGDAEPVLEPGDVFVVVNLSHIGMVVQPMRNITSSRTQEVHRGFISVEGNQADPIRHPEWGTRGVTEKRVLLTGCALIVRP